MAYEKQNFVPGQKLKAEELNKMEQGIVDLESAIGSGGIYIGTGTPAGENVNVWIDTDEEADVPAGGSGEADWNAAEGEPGYIKNRTHWVESGGGGGATILEETTLPGGDGTFMLESDITLEDGKTYRIVYNGTEYMCTAVDGASIDAESAGTIAFGNYGAMTGAGDTGEPFVAVNMPSMGLMVMDLSGASSCNMAIYEGGGEIVHKLDNKFIDAEWMATTEKVLTTILPQADYTADVATDNSYAWIENYEHPENAALDEMGLFVVGKKYIVSFNGVEYECEAFLYANSQPSDTGDPVGIGNPYVYRTIGNGWPTVDGEPEDNGIPFFIATHDVDGEVWGQVYTTEASTPINVGVSRVDKAPKKLPEKFLPELPVVVSAKRADDSLYVFTTSHTSREVEALLRKGKIVFTSLDWEPFVATGTGYDTDEGHKMGFVSLIDPTQKVLLDENGVLTLAQ